MSEMDRRIAGALYQFMGYLTTLENPITLGATHDSGEALALLAEWAHENGVSLEAPIFPGDEPGPCPECKGTELVTVTPPGAPQRCMDCYVHEEDLGESDIMQQPDWEAVTINGGRAGFTLTKLQDGMVGVVVRRFGTS